MKTSIDWRRLQFPYEFLMAALAFVNLYFYYFELQGALDAKTLELAAGINIATICLFAVDYAARLVLASNKKNFFTHNLLELAAIIPLSPALQGLR
ncbi:MAG: hypothetical protein Q4C00_02535, partial [Bacillota bacterium]|nr:hypothetical protein [Bacillota bacterium]